MAAGGQRRLGPFVVQVRRQDDIHHFELFPLQHLMVIGVKGDAGMGRLGGGAIRLGLFRYGGKLRAGGFGDGAGVLAAPGAAAD